MSSSLALRLKTETRALHQEVERSTFVRRLLTGRFEVLAYCALLRNLHAIYATLEKALESHVGHPSLAPVQERRLWRAPALDRDLRALAGPDWAADIAPCPATIAYVARLADVDRDHPALLLAHAYVRYLGDLNGGRFLGRAVGARLAALGPTAVAFYDFGDEATTVQLIDGFREGLDAVVLDAETADAVVAEALSSFSMHRRLFAELDGGSGAECAAEFDGVGPRDLVPARREAAADNPR